MREVYALRHTKSEANRLTRVAFGTEGAPLTERGRQQAAQIRPAFAKLGIDTSQETAAVSELLRTQQTAEGAGFRAQVVNPLLNEVQTADDPITVMRNLAAGSLPPEAIETAHLILENPPEEGFWVSHGLVIAGLEEVLGIQGHRLVPNFGEIVKLSF